MTNDTTTGNLAGQLIGGFIVDFLRTLMLMVGAGALHGEITSVPHPGYWTTLLVIFGIKSVASACRRSG